MQGGGVTKIAFPSSLHSSERALIHALADDLNLVHASSGQGRSRYLSVWNTNTPDADGGDAGGADTDAAQGTLRPHQAKAHASTRTDDASRFFTRVEHERGLALYSDVLQGTACLLRGFPDHARQMTGEHVYRLITHAATCIEHDFPAEYASGIYGVLSEVLVYGNKGAVAAMTENAGLLSEATACLQAQLSAAESGGRRAPVDACITFFAKLLRTKKERAFAAGSGAGRVSATDTARRVGQALAIDDPAALMEGLSEGAHASQLDIPSFLAEFSSGNNPDGFSILAAASARTNSVHGADRHRLCIPAKPAVACLTRLIDFVSDGALAAEVRALLAAGDGAVKGRGGRSRQRGGGGMAQMTHAELERHSTVVGVWIQCGTPRLGDPALIECLLGVHDILAVLMPLHDLTPATVDIAGGEIVANMTRAAVPTFLETLVALLQKTSRSCRPADQAKSFAQLCGKVKLAWARTAKEAAWFVQQLLDFASSKLKGHAPQYAVLRSNGVLAWVAQLVSLGVIPAKTAKGDGLLLDAAVADDETRTASNFLSGVYGLARQKVDEEGSADGAAKDIWMVENGNLDKAVLATLVQEKDKELVAQQNVLDELEGNLQAYKSENELLQKTLEDGRAKTQAAGGASGPGGTSLRGAATNRGTRNVQGSEPGSLPASASGDEAMENLSLLAKDDPDSVTQEEAAGMIEEIRSIRECSKERKLANGSLEHLGPNLYSSPLHFLHEIVQVKNTPWLLCLLCLAADLLTFLCVAQRCLVVAAAS